MGKVTLFDTAIGRTIEVDEATAKFLQDSQRFQLPGAQPAVAIDPGVFAPVAAAPSTDPTAAPAVPVDPALNQPVEQRA